jgi:hypothetical protein
MHHSYTVPLRRSLVLLTCLWVLKPTRILSQELSAMVDDRVESPPADAPILSFEEERRGGLEVRAIVSAAYSTNTFLSRNNPVPDSVFRIGPTVSYVQGDMKEGEGGFVQFAYQPTGVIFGKSRTNDRIDQVAALNAGWRGKTSQITYTGAARRLGDAIADTGIESNRLELENELRAAWTVREKIAVELAAGISLTNYDSSELVSSGRIYGEVAVRYAYSPKTQLGLAYRAGEIRIEGFDNQTTQQVAGSIDWQPREKITVKIEGGAELRKFDRETKINPVVKAQIEWRPRQETRLFLNAYQRNEVSALNQGQVFNLRGVAAGFSQRLGSKWTFLLETGYEKSEYFEVKSTGVSSRNDEIWFVSPRLTYRFTDLCDLSLFHRTSDNTSTDPNFGYDEVITGLELNYQF